MGRVRAGTVDFSKRPLNDEQKAEAEAKKVAAEAEIAAAEAKKVAEAVALEEMLVLAAIEDEDYCPYIPLPDADDA